MAAGFIRKARFMMLSEVLIRPIRPNERTQWELLWKGYQSFYQVAIPDKTTDVTWIRLHDPAEPMGALGAYIEGKLCGIAHYLFHRSCWTIGNYCYLQDLFVAQEARRHGVGRALIEAVEREARTAGASRIYWLTQESNAVARALYDQLAQRSGFIQYRKLFEDDSATA
jgi:GNAT superfamily N-acetyltransferase